MRLSILALVVSAVAFADPPESFDLYVERVRTLRDQPGDLHIDDTGIRFQSTDKKTVISIRLEDLREVSVADAQALRFQTYDVEKWKPTDRVDYVFRAGDDAPLGALAQFFTTRVRRPVVGHYWQGAAFEAPAYHRRALGGTHGTLRIGDESIQFLSDKEADARTWLYRDIVTIGRPDPYRFRITTSRETYVIELKDDLPDAAYELAWRKTYKLERSGK